MKFYEYPLSNRFRSKTPKGFYDPLKGHTGADWVCPIGTEVSIPVELVILETIKQPEMGLVLYAKDKDGNVHAFAHLSSVKVKNGEKVHANSIFALTGNSGSKTTAPHEHWEIIAERPEPGNEACTRTLGRYTGFNIDPVKFLEKSLFPDHWSDTSMQWLVEHEIISFARHHSEIPSWGELSVTLKNLASKLVEWSKNEKENN